jgi:RNA 3'-terminal phosphate cyclase
VTIKETTPISAEIFKRGNTMAEIEIIEEEINDEPNALLETVRRVLMAGVGVVVLAQEEVEEFVNKLIERGEIAEKDGRKLISEVVENRKKTGARYQTSHPGRI